MTLNQPLDPDPADGPTFPILVSNGPISMSLEEPVDMEIREESESPMMPLQR